MPILDILQSLWQFFVADIVIHVGHEVIWLPVAHCELNPIEMAWSQVKGHVKWNSKGRSTLLWTLLQYVKGLL